MSFWAANSLDQPAGNVGHLLDWWLRLRAALDGTSDLHARLDDFPRSQRPAARSSAQLLARRRSRRDAELPRGSRLPAHPEACSPKARWRGVGRHGCRGAELQRRRRPVVVGANRTAVKPGSSACSGFEQHSATPRQLLADARFLDLARSRTRATCSAQRRTDNLVEALFKPIGVTEGISDIPWHKDCGIGRHSYECCGMTVGISVTGADETSGQLRVLAGSHRALVWSGMPQPGSIFPIARSRRSPATSPCT